MVGGEWDDEWKRIGWHRCRRRRAMEAIRQRSCERIAMATQLVTDAAADQDLLDFSRYTTPLLPVLVSSRTQTPLAIGIFGPWGSGKTTLLGLVKAALTTQPEFKGQV